jgi:hypothetical protein
MAIAGDGGVSVNGPACRPTLFGLKSAAEVDEHGDNEWARGLEWDELACGYDPGIVSGQCPALPEQLKTSTRGQDTKFADAFTVYAGWDCSTGGLTLGKAWANAEELLNRNWWRTVERALWTGLDQDDNPIRETFGTAEVVDLTPLDGALDISSGVAVLESYAADCFDCQPIIHGNRGMASFVAERGLLVRNGDGLEMLGTGTLFSPGGGYLHTGPADIESGAETPAGEAWMYVTGAVQITTGPMFFTPERGDLAGAVDRTVNDIVVFAEKFAAIQIGCCVGAVRVVLTGCCC